MKKSELSFAAGFLGITPSGVKRGKMMAFDWDKAAAIIKEAFAEHGDLVAEAGLQGDWEYTGGVIFDGGKPVTDSYTYLASDWAKPTLILSWGGEEQKEIVCSVSVEKSRFDSGSKWDKQSLAILK